MANRPVKDEPSAPATATSLPAAGAEAGAAALAPKNAPGSPDVGAHGAPDGAPPIPGATVIGRGIYVRPRQPYELKGVLFELGGSTHEYVCRETAQSYQVPGHCVVNDSPPAPADQSLGETVIEESWDRFGSELTLNVKAAVASSIINIDPSAFQAATLRSEEDSYYALRSSFIAFWNLFMVNAPSAAALDADIDALPAGFFNPTNRPAYARLFEKYGSHYVKSAWVGGKASLVVVTAKSSLITKDEIRANLQLAIGGGVFSGSAGGERKAVDDKFKSNSTCKVFGGGGDRLQLAKLSSLDHTAYQGWIDSLKGNPQVIQLGLAGIWTLVKDPIKAEALRTAYVQETSFTPLTAIIPITTPDKTSMYFVKDDDVFEYQLRPPADPRIKRNQDIVVSLRRDLGGSPSLSKFIRPDAAISLDGFGEGFDGALYLFKHRQCLRLNVAKTGIIVADGYPRDLSDEWPGVDFDRIDAALAVAPDRVYLFRGPQYIRVDMPRGKAPVLGTRDLIRKRWTGVSFDRLDTAVYWGNSKVYFFYGDQYIRYDLAVFKADPGYPRFIESNYVEDWELFG